MMLEGARRRIFRAAAEVIVPEATALSGEDWRAVESIVGRAVADRPAALQRRFALFLRVLDIFARLRHGRGFAALSPAARTRLLESLERSRIAKLRQGIWGLRTLVFMGYYAREEAGREIGYRASALGWDARAGSTAP